MWIHLLTQGLIDGAGGDPVSNTPAPAGGWDEKKKRKHRWIVEVGRKTYEVHSQAEAMALMDFLDGEEAKKLKDDLSRASENNIKPKQVKKPRARIIAAPKPVAKSKREDSDEGEVTRMLLSRIASWNATVDAIIRHAAEIDDEESLLALL